MPRSCHSDHVAVRGAARTRRLIPGPTGGSRGRLPTSIANSASWPRSLAVASSVRPSRDTSRCVTERSQPGATSRVLPFCETRIAKAIRFEAGPAHREPRERRRSAGIPAACPRPGLSAVRLRGAAAAVDRRLEQVEVGRPGLFASGHARGEHDVRAVRAEGVFLVAAIGFEGTSAIERLADVDRLTGAAVRAEPRDEQVRARAVAPRVPVTHEQRSRRLRPEGGSAPAASRRSRVQLQVRAVREHIHRQAMRPPSGARLKEPTSSG